MNRTSAALAGRCLYRAKAFAWLALALILVPLVPVPAVLIAMKGEQFGAAVHALPIMMRAIAAAIPGFGIPAFLFGCAVGAVMHLQLTSSEWLGDTTALRVRHVGVWPAAVSAAMLGMLFASMALAFAMVAPTLL